MHTCCCRLRISGPRFLSRLRTLLRSSTRRRVSSSDCMYVCMYVCMIQNLLRISTRRLVLLSDCASTYVFYVCMYSECCPELNNSACGVIRLYVCMYLCMHVQTYIVIRLYICVYLCMHVLWTCFAFQQTNACHCQTVYACVCVCIYIYIYIHTYTHTWGDVCRQPDIHMYIYIYICIYIYI